MWMTEKKKMMMVVMGAIVVKKMRAEMNLICVGNF